MVLTDTHTHIYYESHPEKRDAQLKRCFENGISRLFLPNIDFDSVALITDTVNAYPKNCFAMLGLHPCDVQENFRVELNRIETAGKAIEIYAIGEIGIDLYHDKTTLAWQQKAFKAQIQWAKKLNLPIVIHCRDAFNEVYEILLQEKDEKLRGIFHCFGGSAKQAELITRLGFFLGIGGVVTYKNAGLDKVLAGLNVNQIVLETDAPYLTPVPFRGKPNESSYLIYVAQKAADIFQMPLEELAAITTENSKKIFGV